MSIATHASPQTAEHRAKASALALRLAHAENALLALTSGQVDAIIDPSGQAYLLRPAQEHLRQNESRLQAVIESSADMIMVVNRGGVILSLNRAVKQVLGYEPEELVGKRLFELVYEADLGQIHSAFFNVIEGFQENATLQFFHPARDGSFRLIEATLGKLSEANSESMVFNLRLFNSPRLETAAPPPPKTAPAPVAQVKDRFLAMLSHELRTPLTPALLGVSELQQDERFTAAESMLTMIRRNLETQSRLLEELTDYTTVGQHKVRMRLEPIDAHEHVRFVLEICRTELAAAQIEVRLDLQAAKHIVHADSVRLQQVMWNLVKNALKFSPPGSSISIASTNDPAGGLVLEFVDHGVGIEPDLLARIFDAFQQGDRSMQQRYGGLGLGLFIARGLAEAQGGTLTAHSEGRGHGSTFRLTLITTSPNEVVLPIEIAVGLIPAVPPVIPLHPT